MKFIVPFLSVVAVAFATVPKLDDRIVGGQEVDISEFPFQVSVRYYDEHICGGSILDASTILTAGHCVYNKKPHKFSVRVGHTEHDLGTSHDVNQVIKNSDFNHETYNNDMAILKLASSISFGSTAQAVALQPQDKEITAGTTVWVSGWGRLLEGNKKIPTSLHAVNLSVITNTECNDKYGSGVISSHMMCAQSIGHDSCQGDSGGPLVYNNLLIGVVSWGYGCADPKYPGVYAKVSDMHSWIISNSK